jgi:hypothetical protein
MRSLTGAVSAVFSFQLFQRRRRSEKWCRALSPYHKKFLLTRSDDLRYWPGTSTEYVVGSTRQSYDQFALTDRGSVVGQASGYGPAYTIPGNPTTIVPGSVSKLLTSVAQVPVTRRIFSWSAGSADPSHRICGAASELFTQWVESGAQCRRLAEAASENSSWDRDFSVRSKWFRYGTG